MIATASAGETKETAVDLVETSNWLLGLKVKHIDVQELRREATVKESLTVRQEGKRSVQRQVELYNLDVIIAVGYRVKSHRGAQFRYAAAVDHSAGTPRHSQRRSRVEAAQCRAAADSALRGQTATLLNRAFRAKL